MRTRLSTGIVLPTLLAVSAGLQCVAAESDRRIWTSLASIEMTTKARNIDKGTPMGFAAGPDAPVQQNFQIPSPGLLRLTVRIDPYYGGGTRDLNTGGAGVGPVEMQEIYRLIKPNDPVDGMPYTRTTVNQTPACKAAFVKITPPVAASGWSQLGCSIKALVEFSPGEARPGESFGTPTDRTARAPIETPRKPGATATTGGPGPSAPTSSDRTPVGNKPTRGAGASAWSAPTDRTTSTAPVPGSGSTVELKKLVGSWKIDANGYGGVIQIGVAGNNPTVKMFYDITGKWETMKDANYSIETGELRFTRPWAGNPLFQNYRAKVSGNRLDGTFTDTNAPNQRFNWSGKKF